MKTLEATLLAITVGLVTWLLFTADTWAQAKQVVLPIRLVVVERSDISNADQVKLAQAGFDRFLDMRRRSSYPVYFGKGQSERGYNFNKGIKIKVVETYFIKDALQDNSIDNYVSRLHNWYGYIKALELVKDKKVPTFMLLPPVVDSNGDSYMGGVANGLCTFKSGGYAYAIVRNKNQYGDDRRLVSASVVAHELGHLFGAEHVDFQGLKVEPNIMYYASGVFGNIKLPWIQWITGDDFAQCLNRRGVKTRKAVNIYDPPVR
jgi:hypothetical protein